MPLPTYTALRYAQPLREGGSLPAVVDTDGGLFVVKFRGAGQGAKALVAEVIVGEIARRAGLSVPDVALIDLAGSFGRTERDPEIQDILKASTGVNVGLRYLDGAFNYDPHGMADLVTPEFAADVVWLDALTTNVDRSPRNPNLMLHERAPVLIDHGAALYFHHDWSGASEARARAPFAMIAQHVLLPLAGSIEDADARLRGRVTSEAVAEIIAGLPDALLMDAPAGTSPFFESAEANRAAYADYFGARLGSEGGERAWVAEAEAQRQRIQAETAGEALPYRR